MCLFQSKKNVHVYEDNNSTKALEEDKLNKVNNDRAFLFP